MQFNNEKFETGSSEIDEVFGIGLNRLENAIVQENGDVIVCEDGGYVILEDYEVSKPYDEIRSYGDDAAIKSEFLGIMDFDENNPFGE